MTSRFTCLKDSSQLTDQSMSHGSADKPRRSALYVPVNNARALAKGPKLNVDVLIYDLEDAILPDQKLKARKDLATHLAASAHQAEVILRINPVNSSAFYDDIEWLHLHQGIDGLLLPKVRSVNDITLLEDLLLQLNLQIPIWVLVETIEAVINLAELVEVMVPGSALVLGAEDLARQMRISHTPGRLGLLPILTQLVLHGRKADLSIIDAIFSNFENEAGFRQTCEQAKNLGFDGKSLIHPAQISIANEVFSPGAEEIEKAQKIITAWTQKPDHLGVVSVEGQVIEALHVNQAHEVLRFSRSTKF